MAKVWHPRDAKRFARQLKLGKTYYYVESHARNLAPYEDSHTYSKIVFDGRSPITGNAWADGYSAVTLCQRFGPVYEEPPRNLRDIASEPRQVGAPLGEDHRAHLDEAELRGLDKHVAGGSNPRNRRSPNSWRP